MIRPQPVEPILPAVALSIVWGANGIAIGGAVGLGGFMIGSQLYNSNDRDRNAAEIFHQQISRAEQNSQDIFNSFKDDSRYPPGYDKRTWGKVKGKTTYVDPDGNHWSEDKFHKDHWDVADKNGNAIKEIGFDGRQLWPDGPKNKNKDTK